ncbi:MAG: hypothetical protein ACOVNK_02410, partial [Sphingorhabdus lacus]
MRGNRPATVFAKSNRFDRLKPISKTYFINMYVRSQFKLAGRNVGKMAHLGGESSKLLFKVLAEWNHALSHTSIAIDTPPANGNAPSAKVKSSKHQPKESPS